MSEERIVYIDEDLKEIIPSFLDNRQKDLTLIKEHLAAEQWSHIESIAHKLAGNAGSYGFEELGIIGAKLEESCQQGDVATIKQYCDQYNQYMNNLKVEYK